MIVYDSAMFNKKVGAVWDDLIAPISFHHIKSMSEKGQTIEDLKLLEQSIKQNKGGKK